MTLAASCRKAKLPVSDYGAGISRFFSVADTLDAAFESKDSFNAENAKAIAARNEHKRAPNLYAMDSYVVTPMSKPGWCGARFQDWKQSIPWAAAKLDSRG